MANHAIKIKLAAAALLALALVGLVWWQNKSFHPESTSSPPHVWLTDEAQALSMALTQKRFVAVDFIAEWCTPCKLLDKNVLQTPEVSNELNKFVRLRLDVTESSDYNDALLEKYGVRGLPQIVFLSPQGEPLKVPRVVGLISPEQMLKILQSVQSQNTPTPPNH